MKRFHVHLHVEDLQQRIGFCSRVFAPQSARRQARYAKSTGKPVAIPVKAAGSSCW